jgi:hypothetical protein
LWARQKQKQKKLAPALTFARMSATVSYSLLEQRPSERRGNGELLSVIALVVAAIAVTFGGVSYHKASSVSAQNMAATASTAKTLSLVRLPCVCLALTLCLRLQCYPHCVS